MAKAKSSSKRSEFEVLAAKLRKEREFVARKLKELTETKGSDAAWEWWLKRLRRKLKGGVSWEFIETALEALSRQREVGRGWSNKARQS
ncbi:MAG: hypothetical protein NZ805_09230 [Armatimonadetes bacterium]|nr:hypothetical protein [Armatimonadota bacterium]MDW8029924.1 hypothetical protein [Armatimonadota bacterium]